MAAGMVPPLAMALATTLRPGLFSEPERENGRAAWLLGASFISEGAIPFAAADPLRVIPSMMAGGAVTGAMIMAFDVTLKAPHGGIFVFFAIGNLVWFLVALAAGTVVAALAVIAAKQFIGPKRRCGRRGPGGRLILRRNRRFGWRSSKNHHYVDFDINKGAPCPARPSSSVRRSDCTPGPAAIISEAVVNAGVPVTLTLDGGEPGGRRLGADDHDPGRRATARSVTVVSDDEATVLGHRRAGRAGPRRLS